MYEHSKNNHTVLFQTIHFNLSLFVCVEFEFQNSSIWPIDRILLGTITPGQSGHGSYSHKAPTILNEALAIKLLDVIQQDTRWECFILLLSFSRCILQSQPTGPSLWRVLPHCRDIVSVFYNPLLTGLKDLSLLSEW